MYIYTCIAYVQTAGWYDRHYVSTAYSLDRVPDAPVTNLPAAAVCNTLDAAFRQQAVGRHADRRIVERCWCALLTYTVPWSGRDPISCYAIHEFLLSPNDLCEICDLAHLEVPLVALSRAQGVLP